MTELSFLLDLLLNHKLPKPTKIAVTERIKEIESRQQHVFAAPPQRPTKTAQSPSTQRILDEISAEAPPILSLDPAHIAQTPAAAAALAARQQAIDIAISGKEERGRTSPRKF